MGGGAVVPGLVADGDVPARAHPPSVYAEADGVDGRHDAVYAGDTRAVRAGQG